MVLSKADLRNTAYHEAGHALIAQLLENADQVHKVTIIPRGRALGLTQMLPENDRYGYSRNWALDQIAVLFGGRIAEEVVFNEITTGAGNDFDRASDLARKMVCNWGMSETLGPVTFGESESNVFLGRDIGRTAKYSQKTAQMIDAEVKDILEAEYKRATDLLVQERESLNRIAEALIVYETIDGKEVDMLMRGEEMTREPPKVRMTTREDLEERMREKEKGGGPDILGPLAGGAKA